MTLVVDASVVIKWYVRESGSDIALRYLAEPRIIAPPFLLIEFSNVLSKFVRRGTLIEEDAAAYCADLPATISFPVADSNLVELALRLAVQHQHAVYDCLYVALAMREAAPLITADQQMARRFSSLADIRIL